MDTREILIAAVVPLVVSAVVLGVLHALLARRKKGEDQSAPALAWIVPVLMAGAVVLGSWAWQSRVSLWADSVTHRFPAVAAVVMLTGLIAAIGPIRRRPVLAAVPALVGGWFVAWMILGTVHESMIGEAARWGGIAGVGVIAAAQAWAIETGARALPGWRAPVVLWLLLGVIALGATSGFANAPLILWPAAAVCFALAGVGVFRRETNLLAGVGPALAVLIAGVVAFSNWTGYREQWLMFALLMACPLPLALAGALRVRPVFRLLVAGVAALGLAGAQAGIAVPELMKANSASEYGY